MTGGDALVAEALRVNARYLDEVVVGWKLCPFAERALAEGRVLRWVLPAATPSVGDVQARMDEMAAAPSASIGLVIFPRVSLSAPAFDSFAERVRRAERARRFLLAAFHPFTAASFASAPELVSFVRRTPDPTLQLVSAGAMSGLPSGLSAEVARQNFATVSADGPARLDALLRDIRRDRDDSYTRLGS